MCDIIRTNAPEKNGEHRTGKAMEATTENIIKIALTADKSVSPETAQMVIDLLSGKTTSPHLVDTGDRIISREEVAAMIGKSKTLVDIYGRRGIFRRVRFKGTGKRQAQGYSFRSVQQAIAEGIENAALV